MALKRFFLETVKESAKESPVLSGFFHEDHQFFEIF
jgi:hypothetical protein